jgi:hypothetical protein
VRTVTVGGPPPAPGAIAALVQAPCQLLTTLVASAVVGTVRGSTPSAGRGTSSCTYVGSSAQAKLSVTQTANPASAHAQFAQAQKSAGNAARGAFIGDEAFSYPGGITSRVGQMLVTLTGSPPPSTAALETALASVVKQL